MELLTNSVVLPLEEIEKALLSRATPGCYSRVVILLRLRETAAHEVNLRIERFDTTRPEMTKDEVPIIPSNERYNLVRCALQMKAQELRLFLPISRLEGFFHDGKLVRLDIGRVEEKFA